MEFGWEGLLTSSLAPGLTFKPDDDTLGPSRSSHLEFVALLQACFSSVIGDHEMLPFRQLDLRAKRPCQGGSGILYSFDRVRSRI